MQLLSSAKLAAELITCLQEIQERLGYISPRTISWLADKLRVSEQEVYGVASFYNDFRFSPPGKHQLRICLGTACHVQGGDRLLAVTREKLGVAPGETTDNRLFSLERVACVGCCALAPTVVLDDEVHGRMNQRQLKRLLDNVRKEEKRAQKAKSSSEG